MPNFHTTSNRLSGKVLYHLKPPPGEGFYTTSNRLPGKAGVIRIWTNTEYEQKKTEKKQKKSRKIAEKKQKKTEMQAAGQHGRNSTRNADTCVVFSDLFLLVFLLFFCFFSVFFLLFGRFSSFYTTSNRLPGNPGLIQIYMDHY